MAFPVAQTNFYASRGFMADAGKLVDVDAEIPTPSEVSWLCNSSESDFSGDAQDFADPVPDLADHMDFMGAPPGLALPARQVLAPQRGGQQLGPELIRKLHAVTQERSGFPVYEQPRAAFPVYEPPRAAFAAYSPEWRRNLFAMIGPPPGLELPVPRRYVPSEDTRLEEPAGLALCSDYSKTCCPSTGSLGHPRSCAAPCKFAQKAKGCKDGSQCRFCHVCIWRSSVARLERKYRA